MSTLSIAARRGASSLHTNRLPKNYSRHFRYPNQLRHFGLIQGSTLRICQIGVGNLAETIDLLAARKTAHPTQPIEQALQWVMVDIGRRDQINPNYHLGANLFINQPIQPPEYASDGFEMTGDGTFQARSDIVRYVSSLIDSADAHFSTSAEEFFAQEGERFDVVVLNNVLQYFGLASDVNRRYVYSNPISGRSSGEYKEFDLHVSRIFNRVRVGGYLYVSCDQDRRLSALKNCGLLDGFREMERGVFQRIS